jgi:ribosomal-protein-alanine N-acetyltransferase
MTLELRPWNLSDLDDLVAAANNDHIARYMTDSFPHPYTRESGEKFLQWATTNCPSKMMAICVDGKAAGNIGFHPQADILRKNAELGYWLAEAHWGKGIMTAALKQMMPIGFEALPVSRVFARVFGHNTASQKVIEKAGFVLEARFEKTIFKNGEYIDELIYACRREQI